MIRILFAFAVLCAIPACSTTQHATSYTFCVVDRPAEAPQYSSTHCTTKLATN